MAKIVTPAIAKLYKDLMKQVIEDLHKPIKIFLAPDIADCPNCFRDSITGKSTGTFDSSFVAPTIIFGNTISPTPFTRGRCPICSGEGVLTSDNIKQVKALVKWIAGDELLQLPAGLEGAPIVRIKVERTFYDNVLNAKYFEVDGARCVLLRPPTVRGLGKEEVLVTAFLQTTEVGSSIK